MELIDLPKDMIREIIFSCNLEDLPVFLFVLYKKYDYKQDKNLWDNYLEKNKRYTPISKIGKTNLNFIDYNGNINYSEFINCLLDKQDYINCWNTMFPTGYNR